MGKRRPQKTEGEDEGENAAEECPDPPPTECDDPDNEESYASCPDVCKELEECSEEEEKEEEEEEEEEEECEDEEECEGEDCEKEPESTRYRRGSRSKTSRKRPQKTGGKGEEGKDEKKGKKEKEEKKEPPKERKRCTLNIGQLSDPNTHRHLPCEETKDSGLVRIMIPKHDGCNYSWDEYVIPEDSIKNPRKQCDPEEDFQTFGFKYTCKEEKKKEEEQAAEDEKPKEKKCKPKKKKTDETEQTEEEKQAEDEKPKEEKKCKPKKKKTDETEQTE